MSLPFDPEAQMVVRRVRRPLWPFVVAGLVLLVAAAWLCHRVGPWWPWRAW